MLLCPSLSADLPVGAEPGAVSHGSIPVQVLPGQSAGRRAAQPQTPPGLRFSPHQARNGPAGYILRLFLPCTGKYYVFCFFMFYSMLLSYLVLKRIVITWFYVMLVLHIFL